MPWHVCTDNGHFTYLIIYRPVLILDKHMHITTCDSSIEEK